MNISPVARRQALQQRIGEEVPRYARMKASARPYATHGALCKIEQAIADGKMPSNFLGDDRAIIGAVWGRAAIEDVKDGRPEPTMPNTIRDVPAASMGVVYARAVFGEQQPELV